MASPYYRSYILKNIRCPVPLRTSFYERTVGAALEEWVSRFGLVLGLKGSNRFRSYFTERAICCSMPLAPLEILQPLCNFTGWLIITDDYYDEDAVGQNIDQVASAFMRFKTIVDGRQVEKPNRLEQALKDVCDEITRADTQVFQQFATDCKVYWDACIVEARVRKAKKPVSVDVYLSYRIATLAMDMLYDFILLEHGLPVSILQDQEVQNIRYLASKIITIQNDILSYPKEHAHNDPNNYITCLIHERGVSKDDALDLALGEHNRLMDLFDDETVGAAKSNQDVQRYFESMRDWIAGVFDWHLLSRRYFHDNNSRVIIAEQLGTGSL